LAVVLRDILSPHLSFLNLTKKSAIWKEKKVSSTKHNNRVINDEKSHIYTNTRPARDFI